MLHIVQAGPNLTEALRTEGSELVWGEDGSRGIDITPALLDAGHAMPLTTDVILETMRLYSFSLGHRFVDSDTLLSFSAYRRAPEVPRSKARRSVSFSSTPTPPSGPSGSSSPALSRSSSMSLQPALKGARRSPSPAPAVTKLPLDQPPVLLRAGTTVVLCGRLAQMSEDCWGSDAKVWRPSRWEDQDAAQHFYPWDSPAFTASS